MKIPASLGWANGKRLFSPEDVKEAQQSPVNTPIWGVKLNASTLKTQVCSWSFKDSIWVMLKKELDVVLFTY